MPLEVVWNGTQDRQGQCPSICRYEGPSTLAGAVQLGQGGQIIARGDVTLLRQRVPEPRNRNAASPEWVRGTKVQRSDIRKALTTGGTVAQIAERFKVSRTVVYREASFIRAQGV